MVKIDLAEHSEARDTGAPECLSLEHAFYERRGGIPWGDSVYRDARGGYDHDEPVIVEAPAKPPGRVSFLGMPQNRFGHAPWCRDAHDPAVVLCIPF